MDDGGDVCTPEGEGEGEEEREEPVEEEWGLSAAFLPGQAPFLKQSAQGSPEVNQPATSDDRLSNMVINTNKAGMEGLDKEKINKVIEEASKGSRYFENQRKREQHAGERIEKMLAMLAKLTDAQKQAALYHMDALAEELEESRDLSRVIVHLDMDMFYAAVEIRENPALRDKPMAVGTKGMLSTSNYIARRFGVRSSMPGFIGLKLCPQLVIVPAHADKYRAVSKEIREILAKYDPNFCPMSLDEAYFDLTDHLAKRREMSIEQRTFPYRSHKSDGATICSVDVSNDEDGAVDERVDTHDPGGREHVDRSEHEASSTQGSAAKQQLCNSDQGPLQSESRFPLEHAQRSAVPHRRDSEDAPSTQTVCSEEAGVKMEEQGGPSTQRGRKCETFGLTCEEVVREIRFRIEQKTQLTASAGIAPNCMLAKICSDENKPNGQYRIQPTREAVMEFIKDLPIRKISGIGQVTERMLSALGIKTCSDLYQQRALVHLLFSQSSSSHFLSISLGLGSTKVGRDGERKSISTERTFNELSNPNDLYNKCRELCESLAEELSEEQIVGKTVTIKLKTVNFDVKTRSSSVKVPLSGAAEIFSVARELLRTEVRVCHPQPLRLRLMGVRLSSLQDGSKIARARQGSLLDHFSKKPAARDPPQSSDVTPPKRSPRLDVKDMREDSPTGHRGGGGSGDGGADPPEEIGRDAGDSCDKPAAADHAHAVEVPRKHSKALQCTCPRSNHGRVDRRKTIMLYFTKSKTDNRRSSSDSATASVRDVEVSETVIAPSSSLVQTETLSSVREEKSGLQSENSGKSSSLGWKADFGVSDSTSLPDTRGNDSSASSLSNSSVRDTTPPAGRTTTLTPKQSFTCPICGVEREYPNLDDFNRHIDVCLNKSAIEEILQKDTPDCSKPLESASETSKKHTAALKRGYPGSSSSSKRRKSDQGHRKTLHHFFHNHTQGKN